MGQTHTIWLTLAEYENDNEGLADIFGNHFLDEVIPKAEEERPYVVEQKYVVKYGQIGVEPYEPLLPLPDPITLFSFGVGVELDDDGIWSYSYVDGSHSVLNTSDEEDLMMESILSYVLEAYENNDVDYWEVAEDQNIR